MAEDLADAIVHASRSMPVREIAIVKKRLDDSTRHYYVSGTEQGRALRFATFADANNYLYEQGFNRILEGEEEKCWKARFMSMMSNKDVEAGVLFYTKAKATEFSSWNIT